MTWGLLLEGAHLMPKPKTCKQCGASFTPHRPMATVCSPTCARRLVNAQKKQEAERKKLDRMMDRNTREAQKTIPQLIKEAQREFNAYRRMADKAAGYPCISCGRPLDWGTDGGSHQVDCGHYRSTGSAAHLRFDERNAHAQCVNCNRWGAGRAVDYRIGLVARIGLEAVEALESDNEPVKWTREALREIRTIYRAKARELKKGQKA